MSTVSAILAGSGSQILVASALLAGVALVVAIGTTVKLNRFRTKWREVLTSDGGRSLEVLLQDHLRERLALQEELDRLRSEVNSLESRMRTAKRHVGLVRYDAFEDVGGSQSFALAVYDERGDGAVITSLVGRADCRVYCKALLNGRSERTLSQEEQRAIEEARREGPRTIVSH